MNPKLKKFIIKFFIRPFGIFFKDKSDIDITKVKKVLIILLHYRGDVLFATPVIRAIKQALPDANVDVWVKSRSYDIVKNNPYINKIFVYDYIITRRSEDKHPMDLRGKWELLKEFRSRKYDLAIDLSGVIGSTLFTYLMKPMYSVGFSKQGLGFLFTKEAIKTEKGYLPEQYLTCIEDTLGIQTEDSSLELHISEKDKEFAEELFQKEGIDNETFVICIHTTAGWKAKEWDADKFHDLINQIYTKTPNTEIVIVGGKMDIPKIDKIFKNLERMPINLAGKVSLAETSAIINKSKIFIGADSAPLHIAAALDIPTIGLFGPTNPLFSAPKGEKHVCLYKELACSASQKQQYCTKNAGYNCSTWDCMKRISANEILYLLKRIVDHENII